MNISAKKSLFWAAIVVAASAVAIATIDWGGEYDRLSSESNAIESERGEATQSQENSSLDAGLKELVSETTVAPEAPLDDRGNQTVPEVDEGVARKIAEEEAFIREQAIRSVSEAYSLLFHDLELDSREKDDLSSLLVEDYIASTWTQYKRGETIDKEEQSRRIAAIIGDTELQQFRALEQNIRSYWEVQKIASLFERNGVPVTGTQTDELLTLLIETRNQNKPRPPSDAESRSIEYFEYKLSQMDEYQRHVMELAPSVLSPEQVVLLSEQYQHLSFQRSDALESQKQRRADHPTEDLPLAYPAPWSN
jgi:hypothetical protein